MRGFRPKMYKNLFGLYGSDHGVRSWMIHDTNKYNLCLTFNFFDILFYIWLQLTILCSEELICYRIFKQ